jgi:hypothetical protein
MKIQHLLLCSLTVLVFASLAIGSRAYADDMGQFNNYIQALHTHRLQMEKKLGLIPAEDLYQHASSYYDDKEDHYEHVFLMSDEIDKGI